VLLYASQCCCSDLPDRMGNGMMIVWFILIGVGICIFFNLLQRMSDRADEIDRAFRADVENYYRDKAGL
jgi:hypothetical protein